MAIAKIDFIVGVRPKVSRYGQEGYVTRALVEGDEVSCWLPDNDSKFEVGELVYTYFDDQYNRVGFKRIKTVDRT